MPSNISSRKFLLVEDPLIRGLLRSLLTRAGHSVVEAGIAEGVELLRSRKQPFDALITNSPSAFALDAPEVALLYIAAFPDDELAAPFHRWRSLRKPFDPQVLLHTLDDLMDLNSISRSAG